MKMRREKQAQRAQTKVIVAQLEHRYAEREIQDQFPVPDSPTGFYEWRTVTAFYVRGPDPTAHPWQRFNSKAEAVKALRAPDDDPRWTKGFRVYGRGVLHPHEALRLNLP